MMATNWKRKIVTSAGDMIGNAIRQKMRASPAPSRRPASMSSSGTDAVA